jgi:DNA-binding response OmpR family regulator
MKILLIEDNILLSDNISYILEKENYLVDTAFDGENGYNKALTNIYEIIVLDLMLPKMDGFTILESLRLNNIKTPILILSAKAQIDDKVKALDNGCDDYLTKPFATEELLARIRSIIRRKYDISSGAIKINEMIIDTNRKEISVNGNKIELTPKEYDILEFLALNKDKVVSRISLGEHIWGESLDLMTMSNFIDVHVKNIRKKLEGLMSKKIIFTKRGNGFILSSKEEE